MFWAWDSEKNRYNQRKHGLGFETAALIFDDPYALTREDPFPEETRWRTMGVVGTVVLVVVHTWFESATDEEYGIGRIISARKATRLERRAYEEGRS